jgi:ABC-type dipeptide/oligopeptide/nickel transport system ATPase component
VELLSTGSLQLDQFLYGGIRTGLITNIIGESGSGKSQFCFTICANLLKKNENASIIFIDTSGTFRPERIFEIKGDYSEKILNNIKYFRPYYIQHQFDAIKKITKIKPNLVIIDSLTSLIATENKHITRHLLLMKFVHELAHLAINNNCAVVTTNMIRNIISTKPLPKTFNPKDLILKEDYHREKNSHKEFMQKSVSLSVHMILKFEILSMNDNVYRASFLQPSINRSILFRITKNGII